MQTRTLAVFAGAVWLAGCSGSGALHSAWTDLSPRACQQIVEPGDPNETPHLRCPGTAGYALIVRRTEAGRESVDVVDPKGRAFPLHFQETVTRFMCNVEGRAEWRMAEREPVGLIVRVQTREDVENPEKVTRTLLTVAKITSEGACVTRVLTEGDQPIEEARREADRARSKPCAPALPPLATGGE